MTYTIKHIETELLAIDLENPFKLGFGTLKTLPRIFYKIIAKDGLKEKVGFGEASIDFPFSHYDAWDIFDNLQKIGTKIKDSTIESRENLLEQLSKQNDVFPASLCAFNMAIDDLYGKCKGLSLFEIYGKSRNSGKALESIGYQKSPSLLMQELDKIVKRGHFPIFT